MQSSSMPRRPLRPGQNGKPVSCPSGMRPARSCPADISLCRGHRRTRIPARGIVRASRGRVPPAVEQAMDRELARIRPRLRAGPRGAAEDACVNCAVRAFTSISRILLSRFISIEAALRQAPPHALDPHHRDHSHAMLGRGQSLLPGRAGGVAPRGCGRSPLVTASVLRARGSR